MSGIQNHSTASSTTDQGIVDGRPEGQYPPAASRTLDTFVDNDASSNEPRNFSAHSELPGATSQDVYAGAGKPLSGMTHSESRHDGQHGRKKQELGLEQRWGAQSKEVEP